MTETLDAGAYRGSEQYSRERTGAFAASWLFFAHASELSAPGEYVARELAGYPVVVMRDEHGSLGAFHNVCPHRAGPLVHDGRGSATAFVCRYHGWVFERDGALRSARDFGEPGPDPACRLFDVRVDTWRGLVFVNLDGTAPPLDAALGGFADQTIGFEFESFVPAGEWHHDLECNWKTYAENYLEGYHIPIVHKELARSIEVAQYEVEAYEDWCVHRAPPRDGTVLDGRWLWRWPNLALNLYRDSMNLEQFLPLGPSRTRVAYRYFSRDGTLDEEVSRLSKLLLMEDAAICEAVQRNLDAGAYRAGVLSPRHEQGVARFQALLRSTASPD
ncbi:MAG TPA: SRPBCC family protein [Acidimicrobiales bacterium]|nr:SRPBCC family protein [Acidimicrobiales bacterium]